MPFVRNILLGRVVNATWVCSNALEKSAVNLPSFLSEKALCALARLFIWSVASWGRPLFWAWLSLLFVSFLQKRMPFLTKSNYHNVMLVERLKRREYQSKGGAQDTLNFAIFKIRQTNIRDRGPRFGTVSSLVFPRVALRASSWSLQMRLNRQIACAAPT